jgi:hypothetical protein
LNVGSPDSIHFVEKRMYLLDHIRGAEFVFPTKLDRRIALHSEIGEHDAGGRPERFLDENSGVLWDVETGGRRNFCSEEKLQNDG